MSSLFDVEKEFKEYLRRGKMQNLPENSVQYSEMIKAFCAGASCLSVVIRKLPLDDEEEGANCFQEILDHIEDFWREAVQDYKRRYPNK